VFGLQAFEIVFGNGQWDVRGVSPGAGTSFSDEDTSDAPIVDPAELVEIDYSQRFTLRA
jgi:hypothetical protein